MSFALGQYLRKLSARGKKIRKKVQFAFEHVRKREVEFMRLTGSRHTWGA